MIHAKWITTEWFLVSTKGETKLFCAALKRLGIGPNANGTKRARRPGRRKLKGRTQDNLFNWAKACSKCMLYRKPLSTENYSYGFDISRRHCIPNLFFLLWQCNSWVFVFMMHKRMCPELTGMFWVGMFSVIYNAFHCGKNKNEWTSIGYILHDSRACLLIRPMNIIHYCLVLTSVQIIAFVIYFIAFFG